MEGASDEGIRHDILGCPVDLIEVEEAVRWMNTAVGASSGECRHLVTLNPEYVMIARRDRTFREALRSADLTTADGIGIVLAVRWLWPSAVRAHRLARVTGIDHIEMLVQLGEGLVFLLGGAPGNAAEAAIRLGRRFPGFAPAGIWDGGTAHELDDRESLWRIRESGARVVLVAYGAPGQILWIARNRDALTGQGVRLAIGVGGAFDYLAGSVPRAPFWMRRCGLEWLYRLVREPWRWRRQGVLPLFVLRVLVSGIVRRLLHSRDAWKGRSPVDRGPW